MIDELIPYVCPVNQAPLVQISNKLQNPLNGEVFPVIQGIPRFCSIDNYTNSFGFQWNRFDQTQLDIFSGATHSQERFYGETGWTCDQLNNVSVLEAGSGAGRFSEVFLRTTNGVLYSFDYSTSVEANKKNNAQYGERLRLAQASIYEIPFPDNSFDKIFCFGVLQHTPSFDDSVAALIRKAKIGGEIVVDFYPINGWYTKFHAKYFFRPITKNLPKSLLLKVIRANIGWMVCIFDLLCKLNLGILTRFIPITDIRGFPRELSDAQRNEWAILDTLDAFSPKYDNPQRIESVERMFSIRGCQVTFAGFVKCAGGYSAVVRAVKKRT